MILSTFCITICSDESLDNNSSGFFYVPRITHLVDRVLSEMNYFQNTVIFFYLANELLSIIENVGRMGVPIPQSLRNVVRVFQSKSEEENEPARKEEKKDEAS